MKTLQRTKKTVATLCIIVLIAAACLYGIYWIIQNNINKTIEYENLVVERAIAVDTTKDIKKFVEGVDPSLQLLNSRIISANGVAEFIGNLELKARSFGLAIEVQSADETENKNFKDYLDLKLQLRSQGSWAATYRFLSYLENLPYSASLPLVKIYSQVMTRTASSTAATQWIGTYSLSVLRNK
jgi:hypothetical protein